MDRTEAVDLIEEEFPRLRLVVWSNLYDPTLIISRHVWPPSHGRRMRLCDTETYAVLASAMLAKVEDAEARMTILPNARVRWPVFTQPMNNSSATQQAASTSATSSPCRCNCSRRRTPRSARRCRRNMISNVLVDEYQDVNRGGVRLLNALGRSPHCWMVGDAKQSIYRFRGASSSGDPIW